MRCAAIFSVILLAGCASSSDQRVGALDGSDVDRSVAVDLSGGVARALNSPPRGEAAALRLGLRGTTPGARPTRPSAPRLRAVGQTQDAAAPDYPNWEYAVVSLVDLASQQGVNRLPRLRQRNYDPIQASLNRFGQEGWELCVVADDVVIFKRPLPGW